MQHTVCLMDKSSEKGKANLKNDSCQYLHTCCLGAELRICVLEITALQRKP